MVSKKQLAILNYLNTLPNKQATLDEIIKNVPETHTFHNSKGYLSQTLTRMIKNRLIVRVSRGMYGIYHTNV